MMPTDKLTMRSTTFASNANEKIAAAVMLTTPATVVVSKMEISVELILSLLCLMVNPQCDAILVTALLRYCLVIA